MSEFAEKFIKGKGCVQLISTNFCTSLVNEENYCMGNLADL